LFFDGCFCFIFVEFSGGRVEMLLKMPLVVELFGVNYYFLIEAPFFT